MKNFLNVSVKAVAFTMENNECFLPKTNTFEVQLLFSFTEWFSERKYEITYLGGLNEFVVKFEGPVGSKYNKNNLLEKLFSSFCQWSDEINVVFRLLGWGICFSADWPRN